MQAAHADEDAAAAFDPEAVARRFVDARRSARALTAYPGARPLSFAQAYAAQDLAISLVAKPIAGWKLGRVPDAHQGPLGAERLVGPTFLARHADHAVVETLVFDGGFAALEAEFIFEIRQPVPPTPGPATLETALAAVGRLFIGAEMAGSPLKDINDYGPLVVASDFGNNAELIIGPEIEDWRERPFETLLCQTFIDEALVGEGSALSIPNGPLDSVRFLIEHLGARGMGLKPGDFVSTGAATGIHEIKAGQTGRVAFQPGGVINIRTRAATPA